MTDEPLSTMMESAFQAIARMKGDSALAWAALLTEEQADDRHFPHPPSRGVAVAARFDVSKATLYRSLGGATFMQEP